MALPSLAPIPPAQIRLTLAPDEWTACLDAWILLAELTSRKTTDTVVGSKSDRNNVNTFLRSFYREIAHRSPTDETLQGTKARQLQRTCFRLAHMTLLDKRSHDNLLQWDFLSDFCHAHVRSPTAAKLMTRLWKEQPSAMESTSQRKKSELNRKLDSQNSASLVLDLQNLAPVLRTSPDAAALFMTGDDFLDSLISLYSKTKAAEERSSVILVLYLALESLVKVEPQNISLLSDHLFSLKASADKAANQPSALADIATNTPFISRIRRMVSDKASDRLLKLLDSLKTYRTPSIARQRKSVRQKLDKGKGRAIRMEGEVHMHRMSLLTQIQDLFPDLGSGFIMKLLDEYSDDVEQVTAHVLDDSLPPHLRDLDRTEETTTFSTNQASAIDQLAPRSTPPPPQATEPFIPQRRNVFDDDDFDRLEMDTSRLHIGKKSSPPDHTSDGGAANKSAILSALAAFDSDDDERDDTYDVDDVGGTIDTAHPDGEPTPTTNTAAAARAIQDETDTALFRVYKASPELFGRTFDVRRGQARQALKAETGMTDEAIEGWAIMLQRDPKKLVRLETKFGGGAGGFDGRQAELGRTAYRESTETEDSDAPNAPRGGFKGRGRGRGRGGRGGGRGGGPGNVAGPSNDAGTAVAQRRKEESKASRANHNRRDQRAKKMARGGFAG